MWKTIWVNNNNNNNIDAHKLLWDFDIQTNHLRRPNLIIINNNNKKKNCKIVDFAVPADNRIKLKECEMKDKYFDLARESKKKTWRWQLSYLPTPLLGQDMTQGQFLSGV